LEVLEPEVLVQLPTILTGTTATTVASHHLERLPLPVEAMVAVEEGRP
jgi:hypothetical protein